MKNRFERKIELDFSKFNKACQDLGYAPFPLNSVAIDFQDEHHLNLSVQEFRERLEEWWTSQLSKGAPDH